MTRDLSIVAAAAEAPHRIAAICGDDQFTFCELAERAASYRAVSATIAAAPTIDTMVRILAALESRQCAVLVHPGSTDQERSALIARLGSPTRPAASTEEDIAAIVFTSGSSGPAKGVLLSRRALVASAAASQENLGWREDDRWYCPLSLAHVGGLAVLVRCLIARRCVVLPATPAFEPLRAVEEIERHKVTLASLVPTMLWKMLETSQRAPSTLRAVLLGGAATSRALTESAQRSGYPVLTTYGMSETASQIATAPLGQVVADGSVGRVLSGIEVRTREGRIEVRGDVLASGYAPPDESLFSMSSDGWFMTADRGQIDDNKFLSIQGRVDEQILSGGENVSPSEVERAILELPGVRSACVFGVPDPIWGSIVAASMIPTDWQRRPRLATLLADLGSRLASYKLPRRAGWVQAFPTHPTGKVDRRRVAQECSTELASVAYSEPRTPIQ